MEKVYKFVKDPSYVGPKNETFTHYWNNSSINFPDVSDFDSDSNDCYLKKYYPNYHWEEDDTLGINKTNIAYATLTIANWEEPVIFVKFVNEDATEIPSYYYGTNPNSQTTPTENATHTVFQLELDLWATIGWRFNDWMKDFDQDIMCFRRMCDRFIFNKYLGYSLNYQLQPYLMQTALYGYPLIKDSTENSLTLPEWLYINSGDQRYTSLENWLPKWFEWNLKPWAAPFWANSSQIGQVSSTTGWLNYVQNKSAMYINGGFNDEDYNSNGKYKWLVIRTGNNSTSLLAKNPVFRNGLSIPVQKGKGTTPFFSIPSVSFEYSLDEKFSYDDINGGYVISKKYTMPDFDKGTVPVGQKAIFEFSDTLFNVNYIKLNILNKKTSYFSSMWIDNNLSKKLKDIEIDSFSYGVEYDICTFDTQTVRYSQHINLKITPTLSFVLSSNGEITFYFRLYTENDLELGFTILDYEISIKNVSKISNKEYKMFSLSNITGGEEVKTPDYSLSGEELMLIPIKKGVEGYDFIHKINSDCTIKDGGVEVTSNICLSSNNVMGMPINDIPPSVLAMALRNYANTAEEQPIGDRISARFSDAMSPSNCPVSLLNFYAWYGNDKENPYNTPVIVNSLDYIPVNVAMSPQLFREYDVIGGTNFFNSFYELLTNKYLTGNTYDSAGNLIHGGNTLEAEPLLYSPQFWQWVYLIDGSHRLVLTPDMLDFDKFIFKDWTVRLNVNMTDTTHYKLDISDINSETYPFTKSQSELISVDMITHPYSCESFNNYSAYNAYTQETSKNAKDIQNYWAKRNLPIQQAGSVIGGLGEGIAGGAAGGGIWGAIAGGIGGLVGGVTEAITMKAGLENKIKMVNEMWDNQWKGSYGNLFSQPSSLNPSGFSSGSLLYSGVNKSRTNQYETFRTFTITDLAKKEIWDDISVNGYIFRSQCLYKDYDNRLNFNIVNFNFDDRDSDINKYLRNKMGAISTMFSQQNFIDWFKLLCKSGIRLFKKDLTISNTQELIESNIENGYVSPYIPISGYVVCDYNLPKIDKDSEIEDKTLFTTKYKLEKDLSSSETYHFAKQPDYVTNYSVKIPYTYFGSNISDNISLDTSTGKYVNKKSSRSIFMEKFSGIRLNNEGSWTGIYDEAAKKIIDKIEADAPYSSENIEFNKLDYDAENNIYKNLTPIDFNIFSEQETSFASLLTAKDPNSDDYVRSDAYSNGWTTNIELHDTKFDETTGEITEPGYINLNAKSFSKFRFITDKDISNWTIKKSWSKHIDLSSSRFDYNNFIKFDESDWKKNWIWARQYHEFMVGEKSYMTVQRGIKGKKSKELGEAWYNGYDGTTSKWGQTEIKDLFNDVLHESENVEYDIQYFDVTPIEEYYLLGEYNNTVDVNIDEKVRISTVFGSPEKINYETPCLFEDFKIKGTFNIKLTEAEREGLKAGTATKQWYFQSYQSYSSKPEVRLTGVGVIIKLYFKLVWKDEQFMLQRGVAIIGRGENGDIKSDPSTYLRWLKIDPLEGYSFSLDKKVNGTEEYYWSQENRLNSLIFPRISLLDEEQYKLNKKK